MDNYKTRFFKKEDVENMCMPKEDLQISTMNRRQRQDLRICVGVDPNGGGPSDFCMLATLQFHKNESVEVGYRVVALGVFETNHDFYGTIKKFSVQFFKDLQDRYPGVPIFVACENQPAGVTASIFKDVDHLPSITFMTNLDRKGQVSAKSANFGVTPSKDLKVQMLREVANLMKEKLSVDIGMRGFTNKQNLMVNGYPDYPPNVDAYARILLMCQMTNISIDLEDSIGGKHHGLQDDTVMALGYSIYCFIWIRTKGLMYETTSGLIPRQ